MNDEMLRTAWRKLEAARVSRWFKEVAATRIVLIAQRDLKGREWVEYLLQREEGKGA